MDTVKIKDFKVTASFAAGLKDLFTGKPIEIIGHISGPIVTYSAPDAFTLTEPQTSVDTLYYRASMRNGIAGIVPRESSVICPYTGERMTLERTPDGRWYFSGGFNPRRARMSLAEFVNLASGGAKKVAEPPKAETISKIETEPQEPVDEPDIGEELNEVAEKVTKALGADHGRTTVSMAVKEKPREKPKK